MNRTDRLVAMVMHLQGRRLVRAEELARHFEISVRTVYRDIAALGEAGVPIVGEAGVGYSLVRGYHLPPVTLTADEAAALFVGGEMVRQFTDTSVSEPMGAALEKLRAVLPRDRQDHVERLTRQTVVIGRSAGSSAATATPGAPPQPWLRDVQRAVAERRVIQLHYRARGRTDTTRRDVEPLGIVFHTDAWYLVAWCRLRGDLRHFRVDRIQHIDPGTETFPTRPDFSLADHLAEQAEPGETVSVRIWFADLALPRAHRESYATLVEELPRDGGAEVSLFTCSLEWLARWVLSFGDRAEALHPPRLRELVCAEALRVVQRHADAEPAALATAAAAV